MIRYKKLTYALKAAVLVAGLSGCAYFKKDLPNTTPPGSPQTARGATLETGAQVLQRNAPAAAMDLYLVGFHPMKDSPEKQIESHHFCRQMNEDFAQCALYDGNTSRANLHGIEYIISENLFNSLPAQEKKYWHPHNYEILSGQLIAPGLPGGVENELMKSKMNSYGKTWHVWNTGHHGLNDAQRLPMGDPMLAWSFNRDGEARTGLIENFEKKTDISVDKTRQDRAILIQYANPQEGVNAIAKKFKGPTRAIPGVVAKEPESPTRAPASVPGKRK